MDAKTNFHMTPAEFRRYGRTVVDWIADYYEQIESLPVLSQVEPGANPLIIACRTTRNPVNPLKIFLKTYPI